MLWLGVCLVFCRDESCILVGFFFVYIFGVILGSGCIVVVVVGISYVDAFGRCDISYRSRLCF